MVETVRLKENMKRINENAKTCIAVYAYTYATYCYLENKKRESNRNKNKGRTMPVKEEIGLSLIRFVEKKYYKHLEEDHGKVDKKIKGL